MKTTELYLEQVFIGFLIIAIGALPWVPDLWDNLKNVQTVVGIAGGSAALGLAFWLGIPFDRLADTLCDRLDKRNRLDYALRLRDERKPDPKDPYPENQYLIECRKQSATIIRQWDYHRSRIRLSRALAAYGPALTLVATFAAVHWKADSSIDLSVAGCWFGLVATAYIAWMLLVLIVSEEARLPRTDRVEALKVYAKKRERIKETNDAEKPRETNESEIKGELSAWSNEWQTWLVPVLLIAISLIHGARHLDRPEVLWIAVGGAVLTAVSAWSWWRISTTYRDFLLDCWEFRDHRK